MISLLAMIVHPAYLCNLIQQDVSHEFPVST